MKLQLNTKKHRNLATVQKENPLISVLVSIMRFKVAFSCGRIRPGLRDLCIPLRRERRRTVERTASRNKIGGHWRRDPHIHDRSFATSGVRCRSLTDQRAAKRRAGNPAIAGCQSSRTEESHESPFTGCTSVGCPFTRELDSFLHIEQSMGVR